MQAMKTGGGGSITIMRSFLLLMLLTLCSAAQAKSNLAIGQDVYEKMQEAQAFIEADKFSDAAQVLGTLLNKKRLNNYEKAQIVSMQGNLAYQQDRYDEALNKFKLAVTFDNLPAGFLQASLRTIAQLSFAQDNLDDALLYANKMMATLSAPDAFSHVLLAQIYYRREEFDPALQNILKALDLEREQGNKPSENWLLILNAIYYSKGEFKNMIGVLKELINIYPKQQYVTNLSAIYGQLEQTDKQMLLLEPLYDQGRLAKESELLNLANLMMLHKVPYKAAQIIEKGFRDGSVTRNKRNLELLAQSWQLAAEDERSVEYLAEAAKVSKEGVAYFRLAQSYVGLYRWQDAEAALQKSIALGDLGAKKGDAFLLLGMVRFYQKDYRSARTAFREAGEYEGMQKLADQWVIFMEQEREKAEQAFGAEILDPS